MTLPAFDVVIIGAGAAGLMCAAMAGGRGRTVVVLDHNDQPGRKILISGGGRCNFTNRVANAITWASWVENRNVTPRVWFSLRISSRMDRPVSESRLAVGSSARTTRGLLTRARAMATRCC